MAWLPPELELGEEPELKPPELELELPEPEFAELEPVELEPEEPEPVEALEPELTEGVIGLGEAIGRDAAGEVDVAERVDELVVVAVEVRDLAGEDDVELDQEFDVPAEVDPLDVVLLADPGKARASAPAVTTLATVTAVVVDRTLARPRSLAATAWRIPSFRRALLMSPILRSRTRKSLHEPSGRAMSLAGLSRAPAAEATQAT